MKNALTFDVEEYFHAEAFARVLRPEEWPTLESRVVAATRAAARHPRARARPGDVLRPGLGRGAAPRPGPRDRLARPRGRVSRLRAPDDPAPDAPGVRARTSRGPRATLEDATGQAVIGYRAPTFSIMRETLWSLDVLVRGGLPLRLEHLPDRSRPLRHPRRAAVPAPAQGAERRRARRVPACPPCMLARAAAAGRGRRLLPPRSLLDHPAGAPADQRARAAAGHRLPASVGARPRPAAAAGGPR